MLRVNKGGSIIDSREVVIPVGARVAYNYSGVVALGEVSAVKITGKNLKSHRMAYYGQLRVDGSIKIRLISDDENDGHESTIKNTDGIMVITPELLDTVDIARHYLKKRAARAG